jgi:histidine ammonia-lyase
MAGRKLLITDEDLSLKEIATFISSVQKVSLADNLKDKVQIARTVVEEILQSDKAIYGVNTGFGKFSDIRISNEKVEELQIVVARLFGLPDTNNKPVNKNAQQ